MSLRRGANLFNSLPISLPFHKPHCGDFCGESTRLTSSGYLVTTAENGKQGLELIEKNHFDLVLLDVGMADLNGLEVLKSIREHHSATELPVIMVSGMNSSKQVVEALELGANDFVSKPIDFPVALARIQTQLLKNHFQKSSSERY